MVKENQPSLIMPQSERLLASWAYSRLLPVCPEQPSITRELVRDAKILHFPGPPESKPAFQHLGMMWIHVDVYENFPILWKFFSQVDSHEPLSTIVRT